MSILNEIDNRYVEEIKKLAPAKAIHLYHLNRYGDNLSFDEALRLVLSSDYENIRSRADHRKIALVKQLFEQSFMPNLDPIDDDMFYNNYGDEVKNYFDDLVTFDMDTETMMSLMLGADDSMVDDPAVYNMIKEFYTRDVAYRAANFDPADPDTEEKYRFFPSVWLYSYMPFELITPRNITDGVIYYVDPLISRFCELGTMDFNGEHEFKINKLFEITHANKQLAYAEKFGLNTMEDLEKHIKDLLSLSPSLSSGNDAFKKAYVDCLGRKDDYDAPLEETAENLFDNLNSSRAL